MEREVFKSYKVDIDNVTNVLRRKRFSEPVTSRIEHAPLDAFWALALVSARKSQYEIQLPCRVGVDRLLVWAPRTAHRQALNW